MYTLYLTIILSFIGYLIFKARRAAVHEVAKSRTQLSNFTLTFHFRALEKEMATHSSTLASSMENPMDRGVWFSSVQFSCSVMSNSL